MRRPTLKTAIFAALAMLPLSAHAYLDPGTGSLLIQGLLAAVAGAITVSKLYWHRILGFLGLHKEQAETEESKSQCDKK